MLLSTSSSCKIDTNWKYRLVRTVWNYFKWLQKQENFKISHIVILKEILVYSKIVKYMRCKYRQSIFPSNTFSAETLGFSWNDLRTSRDLSLKGLVSGLWLEVSMTWCFNTTSPQLLRKTFSKLKHNSLIKYENNGTYQQKYCV